MTCLRRFIAVLCLLLPLAGRAQSVEPIPTALDADDLVMTSTDTETRLICTGNVILVGTNLKIVCDRLEIVAARIGDPDVTIGTLESFQYLLATGNVRIVQGDREATCGRAEVLPLEEKVVLQENPIVIDHSNDMIAEGRVITLYRGDRRLHVEFPKLTGPALMDLGADAAATANAAEPTP